MHTDSAACGNPAHNASLAPVAEQIAAAIVLSRYSIGPDDVARVVFWIFMAIMAGGTIAALWHWIGRRD